jgi:hypothetical protein
MEKKTTTNRDMKAKDPQNPLIPINKITEDEKEE